MINRKKSLAEEFIQKLQDATGNETLPKKFLEDYGSHISTPTFQDVLNKYAEYCKTLSFEQKEVISKVFWEQVKIIGTPIIEDDFQNDNQCHVYFLFPKKNILDSKEKKDGTKKDLYLQGDFHGYDTTDGRQLVKNLNGTDIMLLSNEITKDAIITYRYIQLEPSLAGKTPVQHHGSEVLEELPVNFFPKEEETVKPRVILPQTEKASDQFWGNDNQLIDDYSTHRPPHTGSSARIFRVSTDHPHLPNEKIDWPNFLSIPIIHDPNKNFTYYDTLYSDQKGDLQHCEIPIKSPIDLFLKEDFSNFTRAIHVFKPVSGKIENVIVVNDGAAYLSEGCMTLFEKMVKEGDLSPDTAFIFITALPGLKKTISIDDPKANMPGMGERTIDYEHGIDQYVEFISNKLFSKLNTENFILPKNPNNRVMIGASLSGTASLYIGLQYPEIFGCVIAQSPSPSNRKILKDLVNQNDSFKPKNKISLSCGYFEQICFAANTNLPYATQLKEILDTPLQIGMHGHEMLAWVKELERSLPLILKANLSLDNQKLKKSTGSFIDSRSITSKSLFSHPKELTQKNIDPNEKKIWPKRPRGG